MSSGPTPVSAPPAGGAKAPVRREPAAIPPAPGPERLAAVVSPRDGAVTDPDVVTVTSDAAVKQNTFPSRPGYPSGMAHWQTHLHVEARVKNVTYAKHVWVDVHVYAYDGALVQSETLPLAYARPSGDGGDLFVLDSPLYEGTVATPGAAEPRPDVRALQYRLYCELDGKLYTDGVVHRCELKSDVVTA